MSAQAATRRRPGLTLKQPYSTFSSRLCISAIIPS